MSQGSPSKQDRIERHLSRQRGAGVRSLTAQFGFSFTVPDAPSFPIERAPEPPRKRVKTSAIGSSKCCASPQHDSPRVSPRAHSRFVHLQESAAPPAEKNDQDQIQQNVAISSKVARPLKRQKEGRLRLGQEKAILSAKVIKLAERQALETFNRDEEKVAVPVKAANTVKRQVKQSSGRAQEIVVESCKPEETAKRQRKKKDTAVAEDIATRCDDLLEREAPRPRRRAAVAAAVKVVEGYVEEEADIDKKRRVEEPVIKKRRGRPPKVLKDEQASKEHVNVEVPTTQTEPVHTSVALSQARAKDRETNIEAQMTRKPASPKARPGAKESVSESFGHAVRHEKANPERIQPLKPVDAFEFGSSGKRMASKTMKQPKASCTDHVPVTQCEKITMRQVQLSATVDANQTKVKSKPKALREKQEFKESTSDGGMPICLSKEAKTQEAQLFDMFDTCETKVKRKPMPLKPRRRRKLSAHTEEDDENLWAFIEAQHRGARAGRVPLAPINA